MCMFCAAIPAVVAVGAAANTRQNNEKQQAEINGDEAEKVKTPAGPVTAIVVAGLVVGSVIYHSSLNG
jgi:hypothetical protein